MLCIVKISNDNLGKGEGEEVLFSPKRTRLKTWKESSTPASVARKEISSVIGQFSEAQTECGKGRKKCIEFKTL